MNDRLILRRRLRFVLSAVSVVFTLGVLVPLIGAPLASAATPQALILGTTVSPGTATDASEKSLEQQQAEADGFEVTVVEAATWEAMSASEFAKYQVLIIGDPNCQGDEAYAPAQENAKVWQPVVMSSGGNKVLIGTDATLHNTGPMGTQRGDLLEAKGIAFAGQLGGRTGAYVDTSCEFSSSDSVDGEAPAGTPVPIMDGLSTHGPEQFTAGGAPCTGEISIVASSGPTEGLHNADLSGWECSVHAFFDHFPSDWTPLALATDPGVPKTYSATDVDTGATVSGSPYILVSGEGIKVESEISLSPESATNKVDTDHTLTATVLKEKSPESGKTVSFSVDSGPNVGKSGSGVTDANGQTTFTYHDDGGAGKDSISATFTNDAGQEEKATATKTWEAEVVGPPPTQLSTSLEGEAKSGASITVNEGAAVTDTATLSGTNVATATGTVEYKVYSDNECTKQVASAGTVTVSGAAVPASEAKTLKPAGTYYWQASYGGDTNNQASTSACGSEVETVESGQPPPLCTKVAGSAKVVIRKEGETERQKVEDKLSTNLASKQKLVFTWENGASKLTLTKLTSASCVVSTLKKKFTGQGAVTVDGEAGWVARFYFVVTNKQTYTFHIRVSKPKEEPFAFTDRAAKLTSETIS